MIQLQLEGPDIKEASFHFFRRKNLEEQNFFKEKASGEILRPIFNSHLI